MFQVRLRICSVGLPFEQNSNARLYPHAYRRARKLQSGCARDTLFTQTHEPLYRKKKKTKTYLDRLVQKPTKTMRMTVSPED